MLQERSPIGSIWLNSISTWNYLHSTGHCKKLQQYVTVGQALLDARESGDASWAAIEVALPWQEFINSVEETRFLSSKDNFDPLHLITERYSTLRKYASRMLPTLHFRATPDTMHRLHHKISAIHITGQSSNSAFLASLMMYVITPNIAGAEL